MLSIKVNCLSEDDLRGATIESVVGDVYCLVLHTNKGIFYTQAHNDTDDYGVWTSFQVMREVHVSHTSVYDDQGEYLDSIDPTEAYDLGLITDEQRSELDKEWEIENEKRINKSRELEIERLKKRLKELEEDV